MTYEQFIKIRETLKHAGNYLRTQRGLGNCKTAIALNQAIHQLQVAEFDLQDEYIHSSEYVPEVI